MKNLLRFPKFLLVQTLILSAGLTNTYADESLTEQEKMLGCVKPKTEQHFALVECLTTKGFARVANTKPTALGDIPYQMGLVDATGKLILPNEYHRIYYPSEWGYDHISDSSVDGLILVTKRDLTKNPIVGKLDVTEQYGLVNPQGKFVVPLGVYDTIYQYFDKNIITVQKNAKYGFVNTKGELVIPLIYDYATGFEHGYGVVQKDGKFGVIDTTNHIILPFSYERVDILDNLKGDIYFDVALKGKSALFDKNAQKITDFEYDFIFPIAFTPYFTVEKNEKFGVIDNNGTLIVPIIYDYFENTLQDITQDNNPKISDKLTGYFQATQGDKTVLLDLTGKPVSNK